MWWWSGGCWASFHFTRPPWHLLLCCVETTLPSTYHVLHLKCLWLPCSDWECLWEWEILKSISIIEQPRRLRKGMCLKFLKRKSTNPSQQTLPEPGSPENMQWCLLGGDTEVSWRPSLPLVVQWLGKIYIYTNVIWCAGKYCRSTETYRQGRIIAN